MNLERTKIPVQISKTQATQHSSCRLILEKKYYHIQVPVNGLLLGLNNLFDLFVVFLDAFLRRYFGIPPISRNLPVPAGESFSPAFLQQFIFIFSKNSWKLSSFPECCSSCVRFRSLILFKLSFSHNYGDMSKGMV